MRIQADVDSFLKKRKKKGEKSFLKSYKDVIIYGAGSTGKDIFDLLSKYSVTASCFLDADKSKASINNMPVLRPDDPSIDETRRRNVTVIVAVFNPLADVSHIFRNLSVLGYKTVVSFLEFHSYFSAELGDRYWLTSIDFYDGLEGVISEGLRVWDDKSSRNIYKATLRARIGSDYSVLPPPDPVEYQYFPRDIHLRKPLRFIDCGAFDGDTIVRLKKNFGEVESIVAFEPDMRNFASLTDFARANSKVFARNLFLFPCGLWSSTGQMNFSAKDSASKFTSKGESIVTCLSLDDALIDYDPTYLKMDIEGAEYQALLGSEETIRKSRPDLAVCLYHRAGHLWQIPLLIKSWNLGYKFYLRQYAYNGFELVMYALRH